MRFLRAFAGPFTALLLCSALTCHAGPAEGLVGHWTLDQTVTSPQGGWSGSLISSAELTERAHFLGNGCYYRGSGNGYLQTDYPGITGSSGRSISVWFRADTDIGHFDTICGWGQNSNGRRYDFRVDGGNLRIEINGTGHTMTLARPINDRQWHHALLTFLGGNFRNHSLYVDGKLAGSTSSTSATVNLSLIHI